ncbi:hypothetical protein GGI25_000066 [Coemansia spiralis]|uniref:Uncharacterized protein n=2 Tax=Coemansia TaxID=4863 RepID=A0A9W8GCJ3_9FUNG|nr:hypothetical protein BX070DRAFT_231990 [Coemansia spiralis]KAJ1992565.1 hypothetical protein EDC05_002711 [Coemansia umbellata]KAJ2623055.1 hypothetical protein GGI26_002664 [Coemansia sp. RSA 1358]KAJ2681111.1 hypothetical protein GGI25_000066 [Coemansia spiralis]
MAQSGNTPFANPRLNRNNWLKHGLTVVSSASLCGSVLTIVVFFVLLAFNSRRVNIPLIKITMVIQSVNTISQLLTLILNEVRVTAQVLCSTMRYVIYTCYLSSIFMCCSVTVHLWLVITRRKLNLAKRNERWYYIVPMALALSLSAAIACIPSSAFGISNRCKDAIIPSRHYLIIRWCLYYGWFVIASVVSFLCMFSVLRSARHLTHTTHTHGRGYHASTEAYRSAVNARANSKRLRSLVAYTIAYPVISFTCNFPQLLQELLTTVLKRPLTGYSFFARAVLYSEGFCLSLVFFLYPAVLHSIRDLTHVAVQYWVIEQEEYWHMQESEAKNNTGSQAIQNKLVNTASDRREIRNFNSLRGRIYHFLLARTAEGRRVTVR